ncbi:hypothetical protein NQD34_011558 [Periophthalmus magnuspinnatus]|nr:hypothetical protein NQD34_011558 [Periophthalmus magnuspinnatus]
MGEARKLQKKLRQIENLEIKISLTPEERFKISRKAELRSRLAELQLQLSGPQQTPGNEGDDKEEKMKRQVEDAPEAVPSQTPPASKILREESKAEKSPAPRAKQKEERATETKGVSRRQEEAGGGDGAAASASETERIQQTNQEEVDFTSLRASWEKAKFRSRLLDGHNDIVTCAVAVDNLVISGSRDTTVKVWHVPTATEQKNLGGHTGGVTCLCAPPPEYCKKLAWSLSLSDKERFILSGSADCNVKIWALSVGQCVKSIYTFNAVTALCFVPEGDGYIVTGSDGGKVQAWSWDSFENCQSTNAHEDTVTSIQSQGPLVFSGSAEGGVSVWENRCSTREPLKRLSHWSGGLTGCRGGPGGRLSLSPRGDTVYLAYGQAWIKVLNWRTGVMSKLTNHSSVAGVTDCVHQTGGLLIGSCYDLTNGESALNLFSLPQCRYLTSLTRPDAPRVLCLASWTTGSGDHRWVTGGRDLVVWEQLPSSGRQKGDVLVRRKHGLDSVLESEEGSGDESDDDEDEEEDGCEESEEEEEEETGSSVWARCAVQ